MNVVVTGASGFLGRAVVRHLRATGVTVVPVARRETPEGVCVQHYSEAPAGDVLVHLAESADRGSAIRMGVAYEREAMTTLDALLAKGYGRVIYASSAALYGDQASDARRPGDEVYDADAYTRVKRHGEAGVLRHARGVAARLTNLYGPGMAAENVMNTILGQIPGSGPLYVRDGSPVRDFLWIDDAARLMTLMAGGDASGIFNVGSGKGTSIVDLATLALRIAGEQGRAVLSTRPEERFSRIVLDVSDTVSTWAWAPVTDLGEGLASLMRTARHADA